MKVTIEGAPDNPNGYDEDGWLRGSESITDAIATFWEAGGNAADLEVEVKNALENL